jgi:hypothetical protein
MKKSELINIIKKEILNEITVFKPSPLPLLLGLQSQIKASKDPKEKLSLAIQCAEKVLPIFEKDWPRAHDQSPRDAIKTARAYLANPTDSATIANLLRYEKYGLGGYDDYDYDPENHRGFSSAVAAAGNAAKNTVWAAVAHHKGIPIPYYRNESIEFDQIINHVPKYAIEAVKESENIDNSEDEDEDINESKILIKEYAEKVINDTITRWKNEHPEWATEFPTEEAQKKHDEYLKKLIASFEKAKASLTQKLNIVVLSDTLKQGQNYLNIYKYSFDDMIKLIKSLPENTESIKKEAIKRFVEKEQIGKDLVQSYVARFMSNRDKLKIALVNGTEDEAYTKEDVEKLIPKNLLRNNLYFDPRNWEFHPLEQMLDTLFPSKKEISGEINNVATDADKIYDKDGIEIHKGDDKDKCISYNPKLSSTNLQKYAWCVTQVGSGNMYDGYRFREDAPTFYFIFDRNRSSEPDHRPFKDKWHAFVIRVTTDGKKYYITDANNPTDVPAENWEAISRIIPADIWAKIKNLKDYFKPIELSKNERYRKIAAGKNLSLSEFKELDNDEKLTYVKGKSQKQLLSNDILEILPKYKIVDEDGKTTTLANIAINYGQTFPYSILKQYESLAKRYAVFNFRQGNDADPNKLLPLPYIKYLTEEAKQAIFSKYQGFLTFEYIEKYLGKEIAKKYVNDQVQNLNYLPQSAGKYIDNPKLKQLFDIYSKLFVPWQLTSTTNMSDEELELKSIMPTQGIYPRAMDQKYWSSLSTLERRSIIELVEKYNQNLKYEELLYALPFVIKDGGQKYVFLPQSKDNYDIWVLMDEQGKVVKNKYDSPQITINGEQTPIDFANSGNQYNRIYDIKNIQSSNDTLSEFVKESLKEWFKLEKQWKN